MGYKAYAYVVYGVEVEYRTFSRSVTKYDEDTGVPYQKEILDKKLVLKSTGVPIDFDLLGSDDYEHDSDDDDFGVVYSDHERDDQRVLGIKVVDPSYDAPDVLRISVNPDVTDKLIDKLTTLGISENPALYSVLYHSY